MINGEFVGPTSNDSGRFSIISAIDIEYEKHYSTKQSYLLRGIIGYDQKTALMDYFYAGLGQRRYFQSYGQPIIGSEGNNLIRMIPRWRFYGGWDFGISQVLVIPEERSGTADFTVLYLMLDLMQVWFIRPPTVLASSFKWDIPMAMDFRPSQ